MTVLRISKTKKDNLKSVINRSLSQVNLVLGRQVRVRGQLENSTGLIGVVNNDVPCYRTCFGSYTNSLMVQSAFTVNLSFTEAVLKAIFG